ncbi:hypothetical protein [Actinacidiphila sp. ITFR-21]|uniref:hypothetical protein n=1 Tax=Actinacidiphila sp. ITFR-21 TaxID=3075199 RepID=UPI00288A51BB|nr:hypothetical protein [Streptomyces sp. ITFR-21]WNI16394.1 hypothetical protein RLT57_13300 [Streptomyces sp. ITFR-21]
MLNGSPTFRWSADWPYGFDDAGIAHFTDAAADPGIDGITDAVLDPALVFADVDRHHAAERALRFGETSRRRPHPARLLRRHLPGRRPLLLP